MNISKDFVIDDLVWAKMKGYPSWPAKIAKPPTSVKMSKQKKPQHFVYFFGTNNNAWILDENIVPHSEHMIQSANKKKSAAFQKAIELITYYSKNNVNKNKRSDDKSLKSKTEKISGVIENRILNKSKSIKNAIQNVKISERKNSKTQNKNLGTEKTVKKPFKSPLQLNGIEDVGLSSGRTQNARKMEKTFKSIQNKKLSAVESLKKPFKSPLLANGIKNVWLSSSRKILETNDHTKHSLMTPETSSSCSQSSVSSDDEDLFLKRTEFFKRRRQTFNGEPVVPPVDVDCTSSVLKEWNVKPSDKSCSQSSDSSDDEDLLWEKGEFLKLKRQTFTGEPVTPPVNVDCISSFLKERNVKPDVDCISSFLKERNIKPTDKKIGFLGLGLIGSGIVKNLLHSGHHVSVYNRTHEKCDKFVKVGAHKCETPADVVADSDIIFSCVSDADAANSVLFGNFGVLCGLEKHGNGKGFVEMTTIDSDTAEKFSSVVAKAGARYLEAPFHGSRIQADEGSLLIFAAGDHSLYLDCETCFQAMGSHSYYIDCTIGSALKLNAILNALHNIICVTLSETLALADNEGVYQFDFMKLLGKGSFICPTVREKGNAMVRRKFAPVMPLKHMQNAMALFAEMTYGLKSSFPVAGAANEAFKHPKLKPYGDYDVSSLYQATKT